MTDDSMLKRITVDTQVMTGKPVIRGTRLTVDYILSRLAHGARSEELLDDYPGLSADDIQACLLFASRALESTVFMPPQPQPQTVP